MLHIILILLALVLQTPTLAGPVTALASDGNRLYIGQGETVTLAAIGADDLIISGSIAVGHGPIRAIVPLKEGLLVLSRDGLTNLDAAGNLTDFIAGGGQRMAVKGNRAYVAALDAGVRVYSIEAGGTLRQLATLPTGGPAEDIAPEGANWLWVAERDRGLRLYDLTDPARPRVMFSSSNLQPALRLRVSGTRLALGYASHLALLDTTNLKAPRLLSDVLLEGEGAQVGDLSLARSRLVVGRMAASGPDVLLFEVSSGGVLKELARVGSAGNGDTLTGNGEDVFVGSERGGLQRLHTNGTQLALLKQWSATSGTAPCTSFTPTNPQPANLSEVSTKSAITLRWSADCRAADYQVLVNGKVVGTVSEQELVITPATHSVVWQVIARGPKGGESGPLWSFEVAQTGFAATPVALRPEALLYAPPVVFGLQTPGAVLAATCAAVLIGIAVIVVGALLIGAWFERRRNTVY